MGSLFITYRAEEVVTVPIPSVEKFDRVALVSCPRVAVSEGRIYCEDSDCNGQEANSRCLANRWVLLQSKNAEAIAHEIENLTERENGEVECWQIMV